MAKVSVIVPIYNVSRFIKRCVESLFNQTLDDVEFIFVNDCTPDDSIDILKKVIADYPDRNTMIINHEVNKGLPAARNTGLKAASGDYIFHCDSDDFIEPTMLNDLYYTACDDNADIVWCDWYLTFEKNERYMKQPDYDTVDQLVAQGLVPEYITIDIAHGHADSVKNMIGYLKAKLPKSFVIAGNVATPEAVIDLENWGADATKVGVGPGKVCITKLKTGFGTGGWQLSALKWCARVATKPIIADGGIRSHGDIAKSVRFGATMVMIGSLFAGHEESPGKTVEVDGELFKEYYGSASDFNKGEYKHVEGKRILEPIKGKLANTLIEMEQDVQSSISYAGGTQLMDIRKVNYVILGGGNDAEHILM